MKEKILIVEDQYVEADYLRMMLLKAGYNVCDIARSVAKAKEIIAADRPDIVLLDIFLKGNKTGIDLARDLQKSHMPFIYLSANSNEEILTAAKATQPYGFLVKPFREKDLLVTLEIARYRHEHSVDERVQKESLLKEQLTALIIGNESWEQKLLNIAKAIQPYIPFDFLGAGLNHVEDIPCHGMSFLRIAFDEYQALGLKELLLVTGLTLPELIRLRSLNQPEDSPTLYNEHDFQQVTAVASFKTVVANTFNMQSHLSLPLALSNGDTFNFCFYSRRPDAYQPDHLSLIDRLKNIWARSIEAMLTNRREKMTSSNPTVTNPISDYASPGFEGIVGSSHLILNVLDQISLVAPSETSVLILGESGTGKEKVARAIHNLSSRKNLPFVKVNCAALPPTLIESELFGHEKGAFTGAQERRIGKFEQANKGTIFLDEIGELPLEFQVKFLQVLQEKEIERIGSRSLTKVDVRIIAATNRNLEKEVAEGRFRLDLYYRLNVFPIDLPPLRERKEDIPILAYHFLKQFNKKSGRKVSDIADKVIERMLSYNWPGNIRELEHLMERTILLAKQNVIDDIKLPTVQSKEPYFEVESRIKTMYENERDHILSVLKRCNGKIWGPGAAAEVLNIPPTTLASKMKKLGIKKQFTD